MLCVGKHTIQVALADHEYEKLKVTAEAAGRSVPEYAQETLVGALFTDPGRRRQELLRVARVSDALNKRLAQ
jgi:hypothetical protein